MKIKISLVFMFALFLLALTPSIALADGIIIPEPPVCFPEPCDPFPLSQLIIRYHRVDIEIQDQIAITHVDQIFHNPNFYEIEGIYVFPLPVDATVTSFTLWIDGQPVEGEVLDAEQARATYEAIVREMRDPALLEYIGQGAFQASIFPIAPDGERRIEMEYTQTLTAENGLVRYVYPLNTEKFSLVPLENVTVNVDVRSSVPIRAVYSPTHPVGINRYDNYHVSAGYEEYNVLPDTDFGLYYSLGDTQAFHLLSYRDPSDPVDSDGFFVLMLAPEPNAESQTVSKDVILVLDRSGSMDGEKFWQAQQALTYILDHLNPEDRFNIITFSTSVEMYASSLRPASEANEAQPWVDRLAALGSTDINRALLEAAAMADSERPTYVIFLTDGLPTEGVTNSQLILDNLAASAPGNMRLFAFGVGYDVDTFLLDSLSQDHHGVSTYVLPGERLDETLSGFYEKISTPVLTDLELDFGELGVYDLYPSPLPDLFAGSQIIVVGRYREGGTTTVTLRGTVNNEIETFRFPSQQFASDTRGGNRIFDSIPRLWATRKIGYLLNQIRLNGPDQETIDQIVRLSIRFGIVTPYTSYLVTEEMILGEAEQERIANEAFSDLAAEPTMTSGQDAVEKAAEQGALEGAEAPMAPGDDVSDIVRIVGSHAFVFSDGVWVDTSFDPDTMDTIKVAFLSEDYFALTEARPELAAAFALGSHVIAFSDGVAYEVVSENETTDAIVIPEPYESADTGNGESVNGPEPVEDESQVDEPSEEAGSEPTGLSCLNGLLPLAMFPAVGLILRTKRKHA